MELALRTYLILFVWKGRPVPSAYRTIRFRALLLATVLTLIPAAESYLRGQEIPRLEIEAELGSFWQSRNDVQIPNDEAGTRFSLADLAGNGPWTSQRLYITWNFNEKHSLRALFAPLSITEAGILEEPVSFAGEDFATDSPVEGTYQFNSWRLGYRYRFSSSPVLDMWVGFTAKLRDAEVRLEQGSTTANDTDLGFVPLLHFAADWRVTPRTHIDLDFDGLAGGPGRAFDVALKFGYDLSDRVTIGGGYRTLEGGADVDTVYNFAWLHYGVVSLALRL
jgi:hypothetical protein